MRLIIFDIQNPIDPQVNGLGLYRSVVNGTVALQIDQIHLPVYEDYSCTHPWEGADVTNEGISLCWGVASQFTFGTDTSPTACIASQVWEIDKEQYRNSEDPNGYRCTHLWEMEFLRELYPSSNATPFKQTRYTWVYCTTMADTALGTQVEEDNDIPPFASLVAAFQEHVFVSGDDDNPNYLYWSKRFLPESFSLLNYIEIGNADDKITQLAPIAGVLGVFTRATKYRVTGNDESGFVHWEALSHRGTSSPKSVIPSDKGVLFVSDDGVWFTNFIGPDEKISQKIEPLFLPTETDELEEVINKDHIDLVAATFYKNKYYFSYPAGKSTENNHTAVYDFDTKEWTLYDTALTALFSEPDSKLMVAGGPDGTLYVMEQGSSDANIDINFSVKTKQYYEGAGSAVRCLFTNFKVDIEIPEGETITATFLVDGTEVHTTEITGDRTHLLNPLPEGCWGYRWSVKLEGSTHNPELRLNGVAAVFIPLGSS